MSYQREFEKKLKVGIVGVGSHAYRNILPTMNYLPVSLQAICDINIKQAQTTAPQFGVQAVYGSAKEMYQNEELDAVFLCVSPERHPELACEAFDAGLHVWMEKPAGMRASEVVEMIKHRKDKVAVVGFKKAFMPSTLKAIEMFSIEGNRPLISILGEYDIDVPPNGEKILKERQFNGWLANCCHPLAAMMAVGGNVSAVTVHRSQHGGGACVLDFTNGAIGILHLAIGGRQPLERYSFLGRGCHLVIENCLRVIIKRGIPFQYGVTTSYIPEGLNSGSIVWEPQNCLATLENKALFTQGFYNEMRYFCDRILEGRPAEMGSLEFALEIMKVYEAGLLSNGEKIYTKDIL
jgi:predicted dehydrogenase